MQHVTESVLWLVGIEGFIFNEFTVYKKVRTFAVILGSNQFTKNLTVGWILIMNRMKHFYFMSVFCQTICDGKYVVIIRTGGFQTQH